MYKFIIGLDIGSVRDPTALAVLRRREMIEPSNVSISEYDLQLHEDQVIVSVFELVHLERLELGSTYPKIIAHVERLLSSAELSEERVLVVDSTGVGLPVVDLLRSKGIQPLVAVTITGGNTVSQTSGGYNVPRVDILSGLQLFVQNGRLKFSSSLPDIETLVHEISNLRIKPAAAGDQDAVAWREHPHDDMAFAVGVALWYGARLFGMQRPLFEGQGDVEQTWNPLTYGL